MKPSGSVGRRHDVHRLPPVGGRERGGELGADGALLDGRTRARPGGPRPGRADRRRRPTRRGCRATPRGPRRRRASEPGGRRRGRSFRRRRSGSGGRGPPRRTRGRGPRPPPAAAGRSVTATTTRSSASSRAVSGGTVEPAGAASRGSSRDRRWRPPRRTRRRGSSSPRRASGSPARTRTPSTPAIPSDRASTLPSRSSVRRAVAPAASGPSHGGGTQVGVRGPVARRGGRAVPQRELVRDRRAGHGRPPTRPPGRARSTTAVPSRPGRPLSGPRIRRAMPRPAKSEVPRIARAHG